ncbi:CotY/CotZ family spore coat protein [Psychrobacillus sp. FJAT-51614]|uniref:CotY/CotZ family spore coat protein n=1 Tax=Psychrobacillus mangrovi TaxID=3117745 RepID=A0ABU8F2B5_9BACI
MSDNEQEKNVIESYNNFESILKTIYETQNKAKLTIFKGILRETIPIVLYTSSNFEPYYADGITSTSQTSFRTRFFRIEDIVGSLVYLSLLYPMDVEGNYIDSMRVPYRLEKTKTIVSASIQNFCSVQCIDPKLVNRLSLEIGDKW